MELISGFIYNFKGEIAALSAAFFWAVSSAIYSILGAKISPLKLNLYKGIIAIILIIITLVFSQEIKTEISAFSLILLFLSGVIGIGLGDTAYFTALNYLGARRTLLLETLAPPLSAFLALIFLGENLSIHSWIGIFLTIIGITWVITERTIEISINSSNFKMGIIWALLAAFTQATGGVLSRSALLESNFNTLWSALIRLVGGTIIVLILLFFRKDNLDKNTEFLISFKLVFTIIITAFMSTYLGIWLQQISFKYVAAGVAQTLLATSPLFVIPIAAFMGDKITIRAILGVLIVLIGIKFLFI